MTCPACFKAELELDGIAIETFEFKFTDLGFEIQWDIARVMHYIVDARRKPDTLTLEGMLPWLDRVELVPQHIWHVPVDLPIIVVTMNDGSSVVIDGNHRVARALAEGRESLLAFFLPEDEVAHLATRTSIH
jgi:hypothetical protein